MGGKAFRDLTIVSMGHRDYTELKKRLTSKLEMLFRKVTVPAEFPDKIKYNDVDFFVGDPVGDTNAIKVTNRTKMAISELDKLTGNVKEALKAFRGVYYDTTDCLHFAIPAPKGAKDQYVQVDVKLCYDPHLFEWQAFLLQYASISRILGSMLKPFGLSFDLKGLYMKSDREKVFVTADPKKVLEIFKLDSKILDQDFNHVRDVYDHLASSWLFHPAHFESRLADGYYAENFAARSSPYVNFIKQYIPNENSENYYFPHAAGFDQLLADTSMKNKKKDQKERRSSFRKDRLRWAKQEEKLKIWYTEKGKELQEWIFALFPAAKAECEENHLLNVLSQAFPTNENVLDGMSLPEIIFKAYTPEGPPANHRFDLAPPARTPLIIDCSLQKFLPTANFRIRKPSERLTAMVTKKPGTKNDDRKKSDKKANNKKLKYLDRWTDCDPKTGMPRLRTHPREKKDRGKHLWRDHIAHGASEKDLTGWVVQTWWYVWIRENYMDYFWALKMKAENVKGA